MSSLPLGRPPRRCRARLLLGLLVLGLAGCGPREVTPLQRKQGASLASEAGFAVSIRDYPRAEGLYAQAVAACPDTADYWLSLGTVRRKRNDRAGARTAYEQALTAARAHDRRDGADDQALLPAFYALVLLDRADDARALLAQARREHPNNRMLRNLADQDEIGRLVADPGFRELAP
ncbi:MAG: hypothetical protein WCL24_08680 [Verrucomicrobiota bacterium]